MRTRSHIHYHTDCDFFAGCENMIANFLNDKRIQCDYDVTFSYRVSDIYDAGLKNRVFTDIKGEKYPILTSNVLNRIAAHLPKFIYTAIRIISYLLLIRYFAFLWNVIVLYRAWHHQHIDLLHINNGNYPGALSCQAAAVAARLSGIKVVIMVVNNIALSKRYIYWPLDYILDYLVVRSVSLFVTGSISASCALKSELNLPDAKVITLHNGILVRRTSQTCVDTRVRLGVKSDKLIFGMVALLERRKGHRVLFDAVYELKKLVPLENMPIILIEGDGGERSDLQAIVDQLEIARWVNFVGAEYNIFDFMQALDVLVFPSVANEDFPNVILEAMSLGKPVIASRIAGTPEQIEDGISGLLVEPGDAMELAMSMEKLILEQKYIDSMGEQSRLRFKEKFTSDVAVSRYLDLYKKHLEGV